MVDFICDYHKTMEQHPVLPAESLQVDLAVHEARQHAGKVAKGSAASQHHIHFRHLSYAAGLSAEFAASPGAADTATLRRHHAGCEGQNHARLVTSTSAFLRFLVLACDSLSDNLADKACLAMMFLAAESFNAHVQNEFGVASKK